MGVRESLAEHLGDRFVDVDVARLSRFGRHYRGKVRDVFIGDREMVMVTTDRLSAFDVVLTSIPCKGAILNAIAVQAFADTADLAPNHLISAPHPNVMIVKRAEALPIEVIVRRHVTGSLWRDVETGKAGVYEVPLPAGLRKDERLAEPIITPSTKAEIGLHDEPISRREILKRGLVTEPLLDRAYEIALALFQRGEELAAKRGLILVDTKYEMGLVDGELVVIDEIHTADSSRYWIADAFEERFKAGKPQAMLDKENIRQWLINQGYMGEGTPPVIPDEVRLDLAETYAKLHAQLLGRPFVPPAGRPEATLYDAL